MNPKLQKVQYLFRKMKLLNFIEKFRYVQSIAKYHNSNKKFVENNPDFVLPPKNLAFDAYSAPAWQHYKISGLENADFLFKLADKYKGVSEIKDIYEWGCGPARVVRHMPDYSQNIFGSDYNSETINWCNSNIKGVKFELNNLNPPLSYESGSFDFIYCISVFTHLSEDVGVSWIKELTRVLRKGGILIITTKGDHYKEMFLEHERIIYDEYGILIRDNVEEGKKMFGAFHNPYYVKNKLLNNFEIMEHVSYPEGLKHIGQDIWVGRKNE